MALTFGYILVGVIVIAFMINFVNFQGKTQRRLAEYEIEKGELTEQLKRMQRENEKQQSLIHTQAYVTKEAEESIRRLEEKLADLESTADRLDALVERYRRLEGGG